MKKIVTILVAMLLVTGLITGCGCKKKAKENNNKENIKGDKVIEDQIFEGLEFVNVGASNNIVKTVVINNTATQRR